MAKTAAERKKAQRARQSKAGNRKLELQLDTQEVEMLERNRADRRPDRAPYDMSEYIALLIRQDDARMRNRIKRISTSKCSKCGDAPPVKSCIMSGDSQCWVTTGWKKLILTI
ncbi:TPA: hypothetical protein N5N51_002101 [Enterobacter hormaechei subsp. xiangfangensis]|uniref:hypothetical protein n=1 Tax=Enterobacter kobei TaxID=208224 RepID=UPI0018678DD8|nr:hypothetical protein [Enterobacter kobei]HCM9427153.1 hypothetical protein [Enterobacter hormaechei subsp. xiangfangensis]